MINRLIILGGVIFGAFSFPSLFKSPSVKVWFPLYIINCVINYIFDKTLVQTQKVKYPVRLFPELTKINIVYDFLVCPFLCVWYSKATSNSTPLGFILKTLLFGIPQGIYEVVLEKKTNTLKFKGNWRWFYSVFLVFIVKIISRATLTMIKRFFIRKNEEA